MKKIALLLAFWLSAFAASAQLDRIRIVLLPGVDGFYSDSYAREIDGAAQSVSLSGRWSLSDEEMETLVTGALQLALCDWVTFEGVTQQISHVGSDYIVKTVLNFHVEANTSL